MSTETYMTAMVALIVNTVLFGVSIAVILSVPALAANAATLIPWAVAGSIVLSVPASHYIAPRLRLRYHRQLALPVRQRCAVAWASIAERYLRFARPPISSPKP